jgi:hypothetical protein
VFIPYAIHFFFDEATDQAIRNIWKGMVDSGVGTSGNRPQISLALCDELDPGDCERRLKDFSAHFKAISV